VIDEHLVVVDVRVMERHRQRASTAVFQRTRHERTDHDSLGHERGVRARWKGVSVAEDGLNVPEVELPRRQRPLPTDDVQWVERVEHARDLTLALYPQLPLVILVRQERRPLFRRGDAQQGRIEERVLAEQPPIGQAQLATGLDQEEPRP
jgi:hypothetical protein